MLGVLQFYLLHRDKLTDGKTSNRWNGGGDQCLSGEAELFRIPVTKLYAKRGTTHCLRLLRVSRDAAI